MDLRFNALQTWLKTVLADTAINVQELANDASFRRYFRAYSPDKTWVVMDAPPDLEATEPFIAIAKGFHQQGLCVPEILAADLSQGFLLLSDLGDDLYLRILTPENAEYLYQTALNNVVIIQTCKNITGWSLPHFDHNFMMSELENFQHWFLEKYLHLSLTTTEQDLLHNTFDALATKATNQPQVCVHRDYHSRNLLWLHNQNTLGILDFQDAVWGPITYDIVSLLKDCYINWPQSKVTEWLLFYYQQAQEKGLLDKTISIEKFVEWFDWMGIQRHLKAVFIFIRKLLRDDDPRYLTYIPRTLNYIQATVDNYPSLKGFAKLFNGLILSKVNERAIT